ncbi:hypothetical protein C8J57DRAFT_1509434 [Mycena rebaudengoi]|nr:hypothetical protein C8J57DRAFT_1509434 [Mycena rebaudengoi]
MRSHRSVSRYTSLAVKPESGLNTTRLPRPKHSINTRRKSCGQQTSTVSHHHLQYSSYAMHLLKSLAMTVLLATSALAQSIVVDAPRPGANILLTSTNLTVQIECPIRATLLPLRYPLLTYDLAPM